MSPQLEENLRRIGWTHNRRVNDDRLAVWIQTAISETGAHIFPKALEFGGLTLTPSLIHLAPEDCGVFGEPELWLLWEWQTGEVLFPIGYELGQPATLAIAHSGRFYYFGVCSFLCSESTQEFLESALAFNRNWPELSAIQHAWTPEKDEDFSRFYQLIFGNQNAL